MSGTEPRRGFKGYLQFLAYCAIVPLLWLRSMAFARENREMDDRAPRTMGIAIVAGLVLFGAGVYSMHGLVAQAEGNLLVDNPVGRFLVIDDAAHGYYKTLDTRLMSATGETEYLTQTDNARIARDTESKLAARLAEAQAAGDMARAAGFQDALNTSRKEAAAAEQKVQDLQENHALYQRIQPLIRQGPGQVGIVPTSSFPIDERIKAEIAAARAQGVDFDGMESGVDKAFATKDEAIADMYSFLLWFVYPGLVGLLFAPIVWAQGRILARGFEPSDSVGFKPYPATAAAWVLLLGAFGIPALFFAAWTLQDLNNRAAEGQIAL